VIDPPPSSITGHDAGIAAIFRAFRPGSRAAFSFDALPNPVLPRFETLAQGKLSIAGDPADTKTFFVGGDEGDLFRCLHPPGAPVIAGTSPQCTAISDRNGPATHTSTATAPHPDSRAMIFDGDALVETDDGGIYLRQNPRSDAGDWFSRNGDLGIAEAYSCARDTLSNVIDCGLQDNGVVEQPAAGDTVWPVIIRGDGGVVAVSRAPYLCTGTPQTCYSTRYYSRSQLRDFTHVVCDATNTCIPVPAPLLIVPSGQTLQCDPNGPTPCADPGTAETTPLAANRFDSLRIVIATTDRVYESTDGGIFLNVLPTGSGGFAGKATRALAAGGRRGLADEADVLYAGSDQGLFLRTAAGGDVGPTSWNARSQGKPERIALDPNDWQSSWVITDQNTVWHATNPSGAWTQVAASFAGGATGNRLRSIEYLELLHPYLAVGASDGLYVMRISRPGHWSKVTGSFPNALVYDLQYDPFDDVLLAATLGRSAWLLLDVSKTLP
jgi:hypothetical protein